MDTWILVADRARARIFSPMQDGRMIEVSDFINPEARTPAHERGRAPPARVYDRFGKGRHAIEARTSPRDKAISQFAATLTTYLEQAHVEGRYRRLVLIAPPRVLEALNATLAVPVGEAVVLRVAKDLTRSPAEGIRKVLPQRLFKPRAVASL